MSYVRVHGGLRCSSVCGVGGMNIVGSLAENHSTVTSDIKYTLLLMSKCHEFHTEI
jgi:hypothetical protein